MFGDRPTEFPQQISFLLVPGFSLFGLTSMLDPLRHANRTSNRELYRWQLISEQGGLVKSSDALEIMTHFSTRDISRCDMLIVCAGNEPQTKVTPALLGFIRRQAALGVDIGSQDTAAWITASAGILEGYRTTMHWENIASTAEMFPNVQLVPELFVIDRKRFSCCGALAGLDMMLHLISSQHGAKLATAVGDELIFTRKREQADAQRSTLQQRLDSRNPHLVGAVHLMEQNMEEPLRIPEIADYLAISERELERLFRRYLQVTPSTFYRALRLERARIMLQQSTDSVTSISIACGFVSLSHFSRCYQKLFAKKPSEER